MRLIRLASPEGPRHACLHPDGNRTWVDGDVLGEYRVTREPAPADSVLLAPIQPSMIYAIGLNYRAHAAETGATVPQQPVLFMKNIGAVIGPAATIEIPVQAASAKVDFECELAVVIGKPCKNVSAAQALDYVLGYTCANDVSARDWQMEWGGGQYCRGKSFDTFCPLGPALVTADEIPDPNTRRIRTVLNGATMQDSNTADMVFPVRTLIDFLSASTTLQPGSVILTGTPSGVGAGRKPPLWLKAGDQVDVVIDRIGVLSNVVGMEQR